MSPSLITVVHECHGISQAPRTQITLSAPLVSSSQAPSARPQWQDWAALRPQLLTWLPAPQVRASPVRDPPSTEAPKRPRKPGEAPRRDDRSGLAPGRRAQAAPRRNRARPGRGRPPVSASAYLRARCGLGSRRAPAPSAPEAERAGGRCRPRSHLQRLLAAPLPASALTPLGALGALTAARRPGPGACRGAGAGAGAPPGRGRGLLARPSRAWAPAPGSLRGGVGGGGQRSPRTHAPCGTAVLSQPAGTSAPLSRGAAWGFFLH